MMAKKEIKVAYETEGYNRVRLGKQEHVSKYLKEINVPELSKETEKKIKTGKAKTIPKEKYGVVLAPFLRKYTDKEYPPNYNIQIPSSTKKDGSPRANSYQINLRFYGKYNGESFGPHHLNKNNFKEVIAVHDAPHSVALFLNEIEKDGGNDAFALHMKVPFEFPFGTEYVKYYTQKKGEFPLVIMDLKEAKPVEEQLKKQGVPNMFSRWCTREYKAQPSESMYKYFDLENIHEKMGIAEYQSRERKRRDPKKHIAEKSYTKKKVNGYESEVEKFKIYESYPIFHWSPEEMDKIMEKHNIKQNPVISEMGWHGCMYCMFRTPEYYCNMKKEKPKMYAQCQKWRKLGSQRVGKSKKPLDPEGYFWHLPNSQGGSLSKKMIEEHPEYIKIM